MREYGDHPREAEQAHEAFDLLAPGVQEQLYKMGWGSLRTIQAKAIRAYAKPDSHLLVMAETAGGKTEAAFLPVLSAISSEPTGSIRAMYVGPLKALINDQFGRLEDLCSCIDMPVTKWHGDASDGKKKAIIKNPGGVLLITPESLESMLINRTSILPAIFGGLRAIVIDELHSFLDSDRGMHLASLLSRLRRYRSESEPETRLIGLSATVGDIEIARRYLSPDSPERVVVIQDSGERKEMRVALRAYSSTIAEVPSDQEAEGEAQEEAEDEESKRMRRIAADLVDHCAGEANLVFGNSKEKIEVFADLANEICREGGGIESFVVHHGSLSRELREDAESLLKEGKKLTAICSSTLEMGIDIGSVHTVGQIGAPWSVASLKQRMGRSGRRDGESRRLRLYVNGARHDRDPAEQLPLELLQTVAVVELMVEKWVEPPLPAKADLSTLTHQLMSSIAEAGSESVEELYTRLCVAGPFRGISKPTFGRLLRQLISEDVVEQNTENKLILGLEGERLRSQREFYAVFQTPVEFAVVAGDRHIGSLPTGSEFKVGEHLLLAAKRWEVLDVDHKKRLLFVRPATRRRAPKFKGSGGEIHPRIREKMRELLGNTVLVRYGNQEAADELQRARTTALEHRLATRTLHPIGQSGSRWMTWTGTRAQRTLCALLKLLDVAHEDKSVWIACRGTSQELRAKLRDSERLFQEESALAKHAPLARDRKYDYMLGPELLTESAMADGLDVATARDVLRETLQGGIAASEVI